MSMFYQVMRTELIKLRRAPVWIAFSHSRPFRP